LLDGSPGVPVTTVWQVTKDAASGFIDDDAPTHAAALAYYTALGMSPLLVLLLWLATLVSPETRQELLAQIQGLVGPEGGQAIRAIVDNAEATPGLGSFAGIVSLATLLFSVSSVFGQLQYALNRLWHVKAGPATSGWWPWIRKRLLSIGTFVSTGFLLVTSLSISAAVAVASEQARDVLPGLDLLWQLVTFAVSLGISALVFALIFQILPDVRLGWRDVAVGGLVTAVLFSIGRFLIGLYLGQSSIGSAYGAAGSLVVLLVWVYYASLVVFFGAEITHVMAKRRRGRIAPEEHAVKVKTVEVEEGKSARA
jgi:membrane protein